MANIQQTRIKQESPPQIKSIYEKFPANFQEEDKLNIVPLCSEQDKDFHSCHKETF